MTFQHQVQLFLTIAPLLYAGIWLIAQETLSGSELFRGKFPRKVTFPKVNKGGRKVDETLFLLTVGLLILVGIVFLFWKIAKVPLLLLFSCAVAFAYLGSRKEAADNLARRSEVESELPGAMQMMTLLVSSGVSPIRSLEIISERSNSRIGYEFSQIVGNVKSGLSSPQALDKFSQSVDTQSTRRFSNSLIIALERGSPLVPVLSSLVRDARSESKNELLRKAGKSEIALMIPVVFLLLPISVLFALFPSLNQLQLF